MRDTEELHFWNTGALIQVFVGFCLLFQFSIANSQCNAVIGSNLTVLEGCETFTIQFYDLSTGVVNRSWDFGDGTATSIAQNPYHSFNAGTGDTTYTVKLTITCGASITSVAEETVTVYAKPKVSFTPDALTVCAITDSICFDNHSDYHPSSRYSWNFGDGTISDKLEPCKIYSTPGKYAPTLTVINQHDCLSSFTMSDSIRVEPVPSTAFSVSEFEGCVPFTVSFDNTTDTAGNSYSEWTWQYDDGSPDFFGFNSDPHTYTSPGEYTIRLAATNDLGCSNYSTQIITVNPSPVASFMTSAPECLNDFTTVEFTGSYLSAPVFDWDFNGATTVIGSGEGPYNIKWDEAGNKDIALAVDDNGCSSLYSEKIQVTPIAKVYLYISASRDTICSGETITFTTSPENFMNYSFYLNSTMVQSSSSNTYESSTFKDGDKIYVNITDANGCSEIISDTVTITVKETPVVTLAHDISNDTVCIDAPVEFTASPSIYDDYKFFVNNTEIQTGTNNLYTTTELEDQDRVNVIATHNDCVSELSNTKILTIKDALPPPDVYCGTSSPNSILFAWDSVPEALKYEISIDNGGFQTASSGSLGLYHEMSGLAESDEHSIRIRALDSYLCGTEIVSDEVTCAATNCTAIEFDLDNKYRSVCENEDITLTIDNISLDNYTVSWDGIPSGTNKEYSLLAQNNDEVPVTVINNEEPSCPSVTKTYVIEVTPKLELTLHSSAPSNEICGNSSVNFTILPQGLDHYQLYDNGDLLESGVFNSYTVSNVKNEHFYYTSAMDHACVLFSDTLQMSVTEPLEIPVVTFESSTESSVTFAWDPIPGATGYLVSRDDGDFAFPSSGLTGLFHTIYSMNPGEAVSLTAIAIGDGICGDSEVSLPAYGYAETCDTIQFDITRNHGICLGDSVQLRITDLTIDDYDIYWGGLPAGRQKSIWTKPDADTMVRVTVKNRNQPFCAGATKYITITVANPPQPLMLMSSDADNVVCQNDQVLFTATPGGFDNYKFYEFSNVLQAGAFNTLKIFAEKEQYNIRAQATNKGCEGEFSNSIITEVLKPLNQPQVNCGNSSETTLSFVWDSIPEALEYEISIDGQPYMTASSGAGGVIHEITGLNAGDSAIINVVAMGAADCVTSIPSEQVTCYARDCGIISYTIDPYHDVCENENITLELTDINIPNYSVSWNNGAYDSNTTLVLEARNDTSVNVSLRDNNQANCPAVNKTFQIDVRNIVPVTLSSNATNDQVCRGSELELTVSPNNFERYVFLHGADTLQDDMLNTFKTSNIPLDFDVQAHVYQNNCLSSTNVITTETLIPAELNLTASESGDFCKNDLVELTATSGFDQYIFLSEGGILEETEANSISIPVRDKTITVRAIDENNCRSVSIDTIKFNLLEPPVVTITSSTDTICFGEFAAYNAFPEGLDNFTFFRNSTPIQSSASNYYSTDSLRTGDIVSVVGTDAKGCKSKNISSEYPYIIPYPDYTIGTTADGLCLGDTVKLFLETAGKDPKYSFYWSTGETTDTITVHPSHTNKYSLLYSDGRCNNVRIDNKTIFVDREEPPTAYAGEDVTICIYDSIQLQAEGGRTVLWSPDSGLNNPESYTPFAGPTETTVYVATVTNAYCKDSDSVMVIVDLCLEGLTNPVPQIITPNGDDINDYWEIANIDYFETNNLKIFNRWGNEVYSANPYLNEWYGQSNKGIDLPDGTYFYILKLGNGTSDITGYVIIHR